MATPILSTDILDVLLDADGDWSFDENLETPFAAGAAGVAQLILIAVRLFLGEWFLALDEGTPWYQELLGGKFDELLWRRRLSERIATVPGVNSITSLVISFDASERRVTASWVVLTTFGDTVEDSLSTIIARAA